MNKKINIWLIGAGKMAQEYVKILNSLEYDFLVIGRDHNKAVEFKNRFNVNIISGGLEKFISTCPALPSHVIITAGVEKLYELSLLILELGVQNVLIEKPGALHKREFENLASYNGQNIYIGYNRRFYSSVLRAKELIRRDGGVTSFKFDFTEWAHLVGSQNKNDLVKQSWFLANSSHVIDLAFLGGRPNEFSVYSTGSLDWHKSGSIYCGAGVCDNGALFNYHANWESAGRWGIELLTNQNKYILSPLEELRIQKRGSLSQNIDITTLGTLDEVYKPGLFIQTVNFLENNFDEMCSIQDQCDMLETYFRIGNYC